MFSATLSTAHCSAQSADSLKVIGIDDWAWRRNHRYASIAKKWEGRP
jgi:hypothetical protein